MKRIIITHFLINLYLVAMIGPALPILEYWLNYDYIANELCENKDNPLLGCNGKCYLEKQVDKQLNIDHEHEQQLPPKVDFEKFLSLEADFFQYDFPVKEVIAQQPVTQLTLKEIRYQKDLLRPPRI